MADGEAPVKSRKPKDTKFKQQKLPAWQPILTASTVLPLMFAIGVSFIPLGIGFLITSNNVQEKVIDYTKCKSVDDESVNCGDYLKNNTGSSCRCIIHFTLDTDFQKPVYMYYSLTNFYQNHRRYVKSRDDNQYLGNVGDYDSLASASSDCSDPFRGSKINGSFSYAPCGAIANSMFNDSLSLNFTDTNNGTEDTLTVGLLKKNIAWSTDINSKYKNPTDYINATQPGKSFLTKTIKPPNWERPVYELDLEDASNNGFQNEDLMVWMRTAALPTFRKLYRRIDHSDDSLFKNGLIRGNYSLIVNYRYPVIQFSGSKRVILTTTSFLGGKNPFLGIAYLVVGSICIIIGFIFLLIHIKIGKRTSDARRQPLNSKTPYYDTALNDLPSSSNQNFVHY